MITSKGLCGGDYSGSIPRIRSRATRSRRGLPAVRAGAGRPLHHPRRGRRAPRRGSGTSGSAALAISSASPTARSAVIGGGPSTCGARTWRSSPASWTCRPAITWPSVYTYYQGSTAVLPGRHRAGRADRRLLPADQPRRAVPALAPQRRRRSRGRPGPRRRMEGRRPTTTPSSPPMSASCCGSRPSAKSPNPRQWRTAGSRSARVPVGRTSARSASSPITHGGRGRVRPDEARLILERSTPRGRR